jgi:hypothetical protein
MPIEFLGKENLVHLRTFIAKGFTLKTVSFVFESEILNEKNESVLPHD